MSPEFRKWVENMMRYRNGAPLTQGPYKGFYYADEPEDICRRTTEHYEDAAAVDALLSDMTKRFKAAGWPKRGTE